MSTLPGWLLWFGQHLITIAVFVMTLVFVSGLLRERRSPGSAIAWLLAIITVPYVGIPLYLFLGHRKLRRRAAGKSSLYPPLEFGQTPRAAGTVERLLLASGAPELSSGNQVELVEDGAEAYRRLLELIDGAQREIHIATFILGHDEVARHIIARLEAKARAGVAVRFLLDGVGAILSHPTDLSRLKRSGARVASFMPLLGSPLRGHSNLRNHRKIVVVDGEQAIIGGMNLAREYMGPETTAQDRWVDLAVGLRGPSVPALAAVFNADWKFATGEDLAASPLQTPPSSSPGAGAGSAVQVVPSGPDVQSDPLYDGLLTAVFEAQDRIWITTPYFILDETLTHALELACRRGVDVRILMPRRSNHWLADLGRGSYARQLEESGARMLMYPKMVHAKATVIDRRYAIVGSANTDMRSFFFNYEVCVFLHSSPDIERIAAWIEGLALKAERGYPAPRMGSLTVEGICRILSPLL